MQKPEDGTKGADAPETNPGNAAEPVTESWCGTASRRADTGEPKKLSPAALTVISCVLLAGIGAYWWAGSGPPGPVVALPRTGNGTEDGLPPIPWIEGAGRTAAQVGTAYRFAAGRPDVLEYVPCHCGCESAEHVHNGDCFVTARGADGKVTEWNGHGAACPACIDAAVLAAEMTGEGAGPAEIAREADRRFSNGRFRTPTPRVPAAAPAAE